MVINTEIIEKYIDEWVQSKIGADFTFRPYQKEAIINVLDNILQHKHNNYIIEAPTGSGKSLINIISAGVLADYFGMDSYILVSDLFLWEQYENFLKKHKDTGIASLKGQAGNYICQMNNEDIRNADCKMMGLSWNALFNSETISKYGYTCAYTCEYVQARKKAIKSKVCIMTYQLFLHIVNNPNLKKIFKERSVVFCDECHNIPNIVQMQCAPTITTHALLKIEELYTFYYNINHTVFNTEEKDPDIIFSEYPTLEKLKEDLDSCWNTWMNEESRKDEDFEKIKKYRKILSLLQPISEKIKSSISQKKMEKLPISEEDVRVFKLSSWYENYMSHFEDLLTALSITGSEYLLKDKVISSEDEEKISITFKCIKEDYLIYMFLLLRAQYKIFCSATVGGKEAYDDNMGFKYESHPEKPDEYNGSYLYRVPSSFDFSKSPIHFLNKFKMSYKDKEISFNHLKNVIYSICNTKFKDSKGIIETGSYYFAKQLYDSAPLEIKQRMLIYNGSREKNIMIGIHKISENSILIGPTLNTGVDLPGDECRFIIILKVPYPNLADKLVKEKIKLFPLWYNSSTSNEIIQGIGRGVRYDGDWCVTYILDACFWNLYLGTKDQYPEELQKRINII